MNSRSSKRPFLSRRRGQALVEFAVIAFVATVATAAALAVCFLLFSANVLQQAADVAAMELSRVPAPPDATFDEGLANSGLYDETQLIVPPGTDPAALPLINRLLYPLYIYDPDRDVVRYPGTVVDGPAGPTVLIPIVGFGNRDASGVETIVAWRPVVEEITSNGVGPYSVTAIDESNPSFQAGVVALRINFPYQAASAIAYVPVDESDALVPPGEAIGRDDVTYVPATADDASVTAAALPSGYSLSSAPAPAEAYGASPHRGEFGLGEAYAFTKKVRPYRKVISAQGIYRREVFGDWNVSLPVEPDPIVVE